MVEGFTDGHRAHGSSRHVSERRQAPTSPISNCGVFVWMCIVYAPHAVPIVYVMHAPHALAESWVSAWGACRALPPAAVVSGRIPRELRLM